MFTEMLKPIISHWYVFAPFIVAVASLYFAERKVKRAKSVLNIINIVLHIAVFVFCVAVKVGVAPTLLVFLCALLCGLLI